MNTDAQLDQGVAKSKEVAQKLGGTISEDSWQQAENDLRALQIKLDSGATLTQEERDTVNRLLRFALGPNKILTLALAKELERQK